MKEYKIVLEMEQKALEKIKFVYYPPNARELVNHE